MGQGDKMTIHLGNRVINTTSLNSTIPIPRIGELIQAVDDKVLMIVTQVLYNFNNNVGIIVDVFTEPSILEIK